MLAHLLVRLKILCGLCHFPDGLFPSIEKEEMKPGDVASFREGDSAVQGEVIAVPGWCTEGLGLSSWAMNRATQEQKMRPLLLALL